jgi:hypothetical protein
MNKHTNWTDIEPGTEVRVSGVTGVFIFKSERNGEVTVWGGSKDPGGIRMFRTFLADRVRVYRPRVDSRRMMATDGLAAPARKRAR